MPNLTECSCFCNAACALIGARSAEMLPMIYVNPLTDEKYFHAPQHKTISRFSSLSILVLDGKQSTSEQLAGFVS